MLGLPLKETPELQEAEQWPTGQPSSCFACETLVPGLASSEAITNEDKSTFQVPRSCLWFLDGTPLDASAVLAGIQGRDHAPKQFRSQLYGASKIAAWRSTQHLLCRMLEYDSQNRRDVRLDGAAQTPV